MTRSEENWMTNYEALKAYILEHGHFPDKHKVESRSLLSWAKYQRKRLKAGRMPEEQMDLFIELCAMRSNEHTGGRRKKESISE